MWTVKMLFKPARSAHVSARQFKVSVVGAASELGQAVSLLLRAEPAVAALSLHDDSPLVHNVFVDLTHIPLGSALESHAGPDHLVKSLTEADLVLAIGGANGTYANYGSISENTCFIKRFAEAISLIRPMPFIGIAAEPLSMFVPMAAEIIRSHGEFDGKKIFGISSLDALRAQALYAEACGVGAAGVAVPVICGHSPRTLVPLFSKARPARKLGLELVRALTERVRRAPDDIAAEKAGEPPSVSAALDVLSFTRNIAGALSGKVTPRVHAFVENNDFGTSYFAGRMAVTSAGAGALERYHDLSAYEMELLESSIGLLRDEVMSGKRILEVDQ